MQLHAALTQWGNSYGASAEIPLFEVAMRYPSAAEQLSVILYEQAAAELVELLRLDAAARLGHQAAPSVPADALVHAGLRLRHLEKQFSVLDGPLHPRVTGRFAATLRRLLSAAQELIEDRGVNASFADVTADLQTLEYDALPPPATMTPSREGATLADQFLLTCLPGNYTMTVHVRVYRPAAGSPVVIIGELSDYHSPGLLESPRAYLDDLRERVSQNWPLNSPAGFTTCPLTMSGTAREGCTTSLTNTGTPPRMQPVSSFFRTAMTDPLSFVHCPARSCVRWWMGPFSNGMPPSTPPPG